MPGNNNPDTRICADYDAMQKLGDEWQRLANDHRTPLLDHAWFSACASSLHADDALHIVLQQDSNVSVTAIAPLL